MANELTLTGRPYEPDAQFRVCVSSRDALLALLSRYLHAAQVTVGFYPDGVVEGNEYIRYGDFWKGEEEREVLRGQLARYQKDAIHWARDAWQRLGV